MTRTPITPTPTVSGELIDELTEIADDLGDLRHHWREARIRAAATRLSEQDAQAARYREALEPFANYANLKGFGCDNKGHELPDSSGVGWVYLDLGHFRRAAAALANEPAPVSNEAAPVCGDNSTLPARIVGCGQPIASWGEVYRCTDCDTPLHRDCALKHFQTGEVFTEEMLNSMTEEEVAAAEARLTLQSKEPTND